MTQCSSHVLRVPKLHHDALAGRLQMCMWHMSCGSCKVVHVRTGAASARTARDAAANEGVRIGSFAPCWTALPGFSRWTEASGCATFWGSLHMHARELTLGRPRPAAARFQEHHHYSILQLLRNEVGLGPRRLAQHRAPSCCPRFNGCGRDGPDWLKWALSTLCI